MSIKLVIFDMDGVLIDSESKYDRALNRFIADFRLKLSTGQRLSFMGANGQDNAARLKSWYPGLPYSTDEIAARYYRSLYLVLLNEIDTLVEGVREFIIRARSLGIKTAIASSSSRDMVSLIAERFGLNALMDAVLTGDDISRSKPDPEIFLETAGTVGVPPENCLVIEDSKNGIAAGKAAGMSVAAFTGAPCELTANVSGGADFEFPKFDDDAFCLCFESLLS